MITEQEHGLSIGIRWLGDDCYLRIKIVGKLAHEDYLIIVPMLENALAGIDKPRIKVLVDALEFNGWELRAAWDDLKLGLKHGREFEKIALVANKRWEKMMAKVGGWFIAGDMQSFDDNKQAIKWLQS
ncbi:MAG: hypothetical protein ACJAYG_000224 [Oceanicoccus sp.]|jgi:hypothetical protein